MSHSDQRSPTQHLLISQAHRTLFVSAPPLPSSIVYDAPRGYWRRQGSPMPATKSMALTTKKRDMETGEDLKGE